MIDGLSAGRSAVAMLLAGLLASCSQAPAKPSASHLAPDARAAAGAIPPPVQVTPVLPKPRAVAAPETYSVVVSNVRAQELLFALARDAKLQIDIDPGLTGVVTLNAIDQTLPQLLARIARQLDMRWELEGQTLVVMRDSPFLRSYKIDYLGAGRSVKMSSSSSTQFAASSAAGVSSASATGAVAVVDINSVNQLWDSIVQNVKDILQETDKILPGGATAQGVAAPPAPAPAAPGGAPAQSGAPAAPAAQPLQLVVPAYREASSVIANRESGVIYVRATLKQHEKVQEFLDQVLANAKRQVLIEATVAEVQLNNQYQRGIDWSRLRGGSTGFQITQSSAGTPANIDTSAFVVGLGLGGLNFTGAVKLLESFGDVKVLSSPKLGVLNNQAALLRVTRDIVYFTITPAATSVTVAGGGTAAVPATFTTTPNVAAEGFMMSVLPQISEADTVVLNVRPTVRRRVDFAADPNPALVNANPALSRQNLIPVFETREFDSILRIQSGQLAVLGGLMQDSSSTVEDTVPGLSSVPFIGQLFNQRRDENRKTELVIFLRATVIRDASLDGDYANFRGLVPGEDFLRRPNPARGARPSGELAR
jgi:general secretion pathway protein D